MLESSEILNSMSWTWSFGSAAVLLLTVWAGALLVSRIADSFRRQLVWAKPTWWQGFEEKRSARRIHADELQVSVSDGVNRVDGILCDLSGSGICVMGIPDRLLKGADRFAVELSGPGEHYSLHVSPRWQKVQESGRQIGASIEYAPQNWPDFVRRQGSFVPV